nr:XRE family transcriptional regulator [uncultured Cohaesibacter sp.]
MSEEWIGHNLKQVRNDGGLSLSRASELTGVSKAMLGQIERGESSPTLATLWKICRGLRLPLTALISAPGAVAASGPSDEKSHHQIVDGPPFRALFPFDPNTGCEVFLHDLPAHWEHVSDAHDDGVMEDIFVVEGAVDILVGDEWIRVERNQALRFQADQPHGYRNPLDQPSRFHNTIHYPHRIKAP